MGHIGLLRIVSYESKHRKVLDEVGVGSVKKESKGVNRFLRLDETFYFANQEVSEKNIK